MHEASLTVCPISLVRMGDEIEVGRAVGTGFLWKCDDAWFLITNWHNVTGLHPDTGQPIGRFSPTHIEIGFKIIDRPMAGGKIIAHVVKTFPLYHNNKPVWLEHPNRHLVDCVAIALPVLPPDMANKSLNSIDFVQGYTATVGDDCFVLGYPFGLSGRGKTPVWKRASIATEPELDHDQRPLLLIDTATRLGMSGSPVILRHSGIYMHDGPTLQDNDIFGTFEIFLGVYSGRVGDDPLGVQLGRVWKATVVDEILEAKTPGIDPQDLRF
ncbi:trypsin-like peptidase domain-containing protein [Mesorhizobium sp. M1365]|uniref:trypsin-like peptidase domain-containing protein n=1 Tax=Mesorhizobium sp. M1365 TaxID=2957090 RepID=UPI003336D80B